MPLVHDRTRYKPEATGLLALLEDPVLARALWFPSWSEKQIPIPFKSGIR